MVAVVVGEEYAADGGTVYAVGGKLGGDIIVIHAGVD